MQRLEVASASSIENIPFIGNVDDFFEAFDVVVSKGTQEPYDDIALIPLPVRKEWQKRQLQSSNSTISRGQSAEQWELKIYPAQNSVLSPSYRSLARTMEKTDNRSYLRINDLLARHFVASPATVLDKTVPYATCEAPTDIDLNLKSAVSFGGATLVSALAADRVPIENIDHPLLGAAYDACYEQEIGSFLLDLASVRDW